MSNSLISQEKLEVEGNSKLENVILTSKSNRSILVEQALDNSTDGKTLTIIAGDARNGPAARNGGKLILGAGNGINSSQPVGGGNIILRSGANLLIAEQGKKNGGDIIFETGGPSSTFLERMRIIEDGSVGIGTSTPSATLDVVGNTELNGQTTLTGNLGIGTNSPLFKLDVKSSDSTRDIVRSEATWSTGSNSNKAALVGKNVVDSGFGFGVAGEGGMAGVLGNSPGTGTGVQGNAFGGGIGVSGSAGSGGIGLLGNSGIGVKGTGNIIGVVGEVVGTNSENYGGFFTATGAAPINIGVYGTASGATTNIAAFFEGDAAVTGKLTVTGSDFAEYFHINTIKESQEISKGMLLVIDKENAGQLTPCTDAYDKKVAGIVSGAGGVTTGLVMGEPNTLADGDIPVALSGRVYCHADASFGAIEIGDLLTTSSTYGHAMKARRLKKARGAIIGKAMTSLSEGRGIVLVLINAQ